MFIAARIKGFLDRYKVHCRAFSYLNSNSKVFVFTQINRLEKKLLGIGHSLKIVRGGHTDLGCFLMSYWEMPESFAVVAKEHHNLAYSGSYAEYLKIIQISNQALALIGIGDEKKTNISDELLEFFAIAEPEIQLKLNELRAFI